MKKRKLAMKGDATEDSALQIARAKTNGDKQNVNAKTNMNNSKTPLKSSAKSKQHLLPAPTKSTNGIVGGTPKVVQKTSISKSRRRSEPVKRTSK